MADSTEKARAKALYAAAVREGAPSPSPDNLPTGLTYEEALDIFDQRARTQ